jgi:hypothetical protein
VASRLYPPSSSSSSSSAKTAKRRKRPEAMKVKKHRVALTVA